MSMPIQRRPSFCAACDGGAAAAERVEHHVAGVAAGGDDALEQGEGLLGGVAEAFVGLRVDRRNVVQTS